MATMRAVGLLGALLVSLGCGGTRVSSIQQIRETLAMAENYGKIDEEVLAWCEEHPGEAVRVYLRLQIDKEALGLEREVSPYSEERSAVKRRSREIREAGKGPGRSLSEEAKAELRRLEARRRELYELGEAYTQEIRERNEGRLEEAYQAVWPRAVEQIRQIEGVEIKIREYPEPHPVPTLTAPASALSRIGAIPEIGRIELVKLFVPMIDVSRSVIGADYVQDQMDIKGTGVRVALADSGIHAGPVPDEHPSMAGTPGVDQRRDFSGSGTVWDGTNHGTAVAGVVRADITQDSVAYVGMAPDCELINAKFYDDLAGGDIDDAKAAIEWAIEDRYTQARVVNLSSADPGFLGTGNTNPEQSLDWFATEYPEVVLCNAVGNEGVYSGGEEDQVPRPGAAYNTIVVQAFDDHRDTDVAKHTRVSYDAPVGPIRNTGRRKPDMAAPGQATAGSDLGIWTARVWEDPNAAPPLL